MAKIMHGKALYNLDINKEYLVYYSGAYSETGQPVTHACEGFGKIDRTLGDSKWHAYLYGCGPNYSKITVKVTSINSSFIVEL